jgi:endonuclease/exonuclease/phosphatase family metal-dependent hydrolase
MRVRCLTLNLKGLEAWHEDRDRLALAGLRQIFADVICLQELSIQDSPFPYDQMDAIAHTLRWENRIFCPYGNDLDGSSEVRKGLALLSRWPFTRVEMRCLPPGGPQDRRSALLALIQTSAGPLQVINTHLSWEPEKSLIRLAQMETLLKYVGKLPLILAGDMNAGENEASIRSTQDKLIDCYRQLHPDGAGYTWLKSNPRVAGADQHLDDRRADYIFSNPWVHVHSATIVLDQPDYVSDHFGVLVDLEWKKGSQ